MVTSTRVRCASSTTTTTTGRRSNAAKVRRRRRERRRRRGEVRCVCVDDDDDYCVVWVTTDHPPRRMGDRGRPDPTRSLRTTRPGNRTRLRSRSRRNAEEIGRARAGCTDARMAGCSRRTSPPSAREGCCSLSCPLCSPLSARPWVVDEHPADPKTAIRKEKVTRL